MPDDTEETFTDGYLLYLLAHASHAASDAFHKELEAENIPVSTWRIVTSLYPDQALNVGRLAEKCLLKQPTLTRILDRLSKSDYVERLVAAEDRRGVKIRLTDKGRDLAERLIRKARHHEARIMSGFSAGDRDTFLRQLRRLLERSRGA